MAVDPEWLDAVVTLSPATTDFTENLRAFHSEVHCPTEDEAGPLRIGTVTGWVSPYCDPFHTWEAADSLSARAELLATGYVALERGGELPAHDHVMLVDRATIAPGYRDDRLLRRMLEQGFSTIPELGHLWLPPGGGAPPRLRLIAGKKPG